VPFQSSYLKQALAPRATIYRPLTRAWLPYVAAGELGSWGLFSGG
jgi:hypothetical protein